MDACTSDDWRLVLQTQGGQVEAVGGHEVRGLAKVLACSDQLYTLDHICVRMMNSNLKS